MPTSDDRLEQAQRERDQLRLRLTQVGDLRPGSLLERHCRCGKPACHCAREGDPGHGPYWYLTREVGGKTVSHLIPASAAELTAQQVAEYQRFRELSRQFVEASERLCELKLSALDRKFCDVFVNRSDGLTLGAVHRSCGAGR